MKKVKIEVCPICSSIDIFSRDRFFVCGGCGHETAGIKSTSELDDYYNKDDVGLKVQNILEASQDSPFRGYHKRAYEVIKGKKKVKNICDIGCGVGTMLTYLQQKRYQVYGYDINETQTQIAREKYGLSNVGYAETLDEYCHKKRIKREFFDAITAFEVIEHIPDVNAFIDESSKYLRKGGYIIFSTPNSKRLPLKESWDYPPIHLSRFNKKNISVLLKKHGFELVSWESYSELGYYSNNFIHKLPASKRMLSELVNSDAKMSSVERKLMFVTTTKKIVCLLLDIPVYFALLPFKERGHTMFFVGKKVI